MTGLATHLFHQELERKSDIKKFAAKVAKARKLKELPELHHHDLRTYCETLINAAGLLQRINEMECSSRVDLMRPDINEETSLGDDIQQGIIKICKEQLGLETEFNGDPRGAAVKLIVHESLGDSWGDRTHLCVPTFDCFVC